VSDPRLTQLEERREQVLDDLRELETQVAAGEIDEAAASRLRRRYESAAVDVMNSIDSLSPAEPAGRSRRRMLLGAGTFVVVAAIVTFTLISAVEPRPEGGFTASGVAAEVIEDSPVDLSTITNDEMEAVVAANPEVISMRLALARRYVDSGDFSSALPHYMFVLDREANPEALTYVGWMTYLSGDATTGAALLRRSLEVLPDDPLTEWFLANTLLNGTGETTEAVLLLEGLLQHEDLPQEFETEAQRMLDEASQ
jgi:cytochrome c-type biogenesis protein CcmH/NrfG